MHNSFAKLTGFCFTPLNNHLVTVEDSDTFLVSYPKSGNTWIRFIISNILFPATLTNFKNIENRVPDVHNLNALKILNAKKPRILKSHFPFKPEYPKVLYIVRNPKSVVISEYHYFQRVGREKEAPDFNQFFDLFMESPNPQFGNWGEHLNSWFEGVDKDKAFKIIRYEDIKEAPLYYAGQIADFIKITADDQQLEDALYKSSFHKMKALEESTESKKSNVPFVRKGKSQEWRDFLSKSQEDHIEQKFGKAMKKVGYL